MFLRHKKWAALYAGMRVAVLAASVKMRIANDAGRCFARSDADQDEVKATLFSWCQWWWQRRLTHIPWQAMVSLINKRVGNSRPTQWPWPAADMWLPSHSDCDTCQCLYMSSSLSMFFFLLQVYYWLGSGSSFGHYKLGTGPIPSSSMYIDPI